MFIRRSFDRLARPFWDAFSPSSRDLIDLMSMAVPFIALAWIDQPADVVYVVCCMFLVLVARKSGERSIVAA